MAANKRTGKENRQPDAFPTKPRSCLNLRHGVKGEQGVPGWLRKSGRRSQLLIVLANMSWPPPCRFHNSWCAAFGSKPQQDLDVFFFSPLAVATTVSSFSYHFSILTISKPVSFFPTYTVLSMWNRMNIQKLFTVEPPKPLKIYNVKAVHLKSPWKCYTQCCACKNSVIRKTFSFHN